jgi:DNA-binding transcriptional LysR family regulator
MHIWFLVMSHRRSRAANVAKSHALTPISVAQALSVQEYLSFRRAAKILGVRQSAVGRRVRALEDELGVSLFERHRTGVRVTNAGDRFLREARAALLQLDHAVRAAAAAGTGAIGQVSIGIFSSIAAGYLRELIQVYCSQHPDVRVQVLEGTSADNITAVRNRQLDVAFITDFTNANGCEILPLWTERIFVILPERHALRGRKEIQWTDLRDERLIVRQSCDPAFHDRLNSRFTGGSRGADLRKLNVGRGTLINLVAIGLGVGVTSEATIAVPIPRVVFRPIAGADEVLRFSAAWLPQNDNPAFRRLLSLARKMAVENRRGSSSAPSQTSIKSYIPQASLFLASLAALARRLGLLT